VSDCIRSALPRRILIPVVVTLAGAWLALVPLLGSAADTEQSELDYSTSQRSAASRAAEWNLSSSQWTRYQSVMKGPRGLWSPDIDPLYVLGIYAETEADRRRFAELVVQQEYERVEKELAFQREVNAAWKRLYGDVAMIDPARLGLGVERRAPAAGASKAGQNAFLFLTVADCSGCDTAVNQWLRKLRADPAVTLRIYLSGADQRVVLLRWIRDHDLGELIKARRVVVQADNGMLAKVMASRAMPAFPYTVIR